MADVKCVLFHDNFQNFKGYSIPKAQLVIADIPYNIGTDFYASRPDWYVGGDNKNGESSKAGKAAFHTDFTFNIAEYFAFCSRLLKKEPSKGEKDAPCMVVFCSFQQIPEVIKTAEKHGFKNYIPLVFCKNYSPSVLKSNMKIVGATEYALVLYRGKLPKFRNIDVDGKHHMIFNWFEWRKDSTKEYPKIHPSQKPISVLKRLIEIFTDPGDVVIDPCAGSGSTLRAARELGAAATALKSAKNFIQKPVSRCSDRQRTEDLKMNEIAIAVNYENEKPTVSGRELHKALKINTKYPDLYASFAQAESESISKNVTWGIEKAFQEGKVRYKLDQTLGYRMGADGKPEIVESEAEHVRWIFRMFADGHSMREIATILTEKKIMRRNGETAWTRTNVQRILTNEKYVGDAILQKSYTVDCLTHERRKNSGERTKYYLRDCHDAIIDRDTWDRVHLEFARRSAEIKGRHSGKKYAKRYCFSDLLTCPYCGGNYKRTIWKIGEKSVGVWRCGRRIDHGSRICSKGASLHEDKLQNAVVAIVNDMIENPEKVEAAIMESMNKFRTEITEIDTQLMDISTELERIRTRRDDILTVITGEAFE